MVNAARGLAKAIGERLQKCDAGSAQPCERHPAALKSVEAIGQQIAEYLGVRVVPLAIGVSLPGPGGLGRRPGIASGPLRRYQ